MVCDNKVKLKVTFKKQTLTAWKKLCPAAVTAHGAAYARVQSEPLPLSASCQSCQTLPSCAENELPRNCPSHTGVPLSQMYNLSEDTYKGKKKKMLLHNKKSKFKLLWHSIYPEAEPSVLDWTVTGLVVLVWDLRGPYHRKICTMMHTSAESPAERQANVVLIQKKERSPKEPAATVVQQPPSLISTLQRKGSWGSERSWERNRREKLCWEGSKLHRTAFLFSADIMKSLRTKLLEVVLFWSGKSDIWITEEEKCWLSNCRAGSLG